MARTKKPKGLAVGEKRITLSEAAGLLGYRSTSTLRGAALVGELPVERIGKRFLVTTETAARAWADGQRTGDYKRGESRHRGQPRPAKEEQP